MSEVVTGVEVNFSTSGGSHVATVSTSETQGVCGGGELGSISGKIGKRSTFTKAQIDSLLQNFVLQETSTTKDAYGIKKQYKYIDKLSQKLDSWVVLTRGSTASPVGDQSSAYNYKGKLYQSTELPNTAFYKDTPPAQLNKTAESTYIDNSKRIIVLGTTYSVVSTVKNQNTAKNEKIFHVYKNKIKQPTLSLGGEFKAVASDASIKYGYTAKEFFSAISSVGITVTSPPTFKDNLFDVSGTLRSCISSILSFYGYYWYVENKSIVLISSQLANSIKIIDETSSADPTILSATFTKGGSSPRLVCSFVGTTNPENNNTGKGTPMQVSPQANRKVFKRLNLGDLFSRANKKSLSVDELAGFFTFFTSNYSKSTANFDKFVYFLLHAGADFSPAYSDELFEKGTSKKLDDIVPSSSVKDYENAGKKMFIKSDSRYLSIMNEDATALAQKPSENLIYSIMNLYFKFASSTFISNGYSQNYADVLQFVDSSATVAGPFEASKSIKDIELFSELANFIASCGLDVPSVKQIANKAGTRAGEIYWVAQKPSDLSNDADEDFSFLDSCILGFNNDQAHSYMAIKSPPASVASLKTVLRNSSRAYGKAVKKLDAKILLAAIRNYGDKKEEESAPDDQQDQEFPSYEETFFSVKSQSVDDFSKSELKSYSGNAGEAEILSNSSSLTSSTLALNSSSVTYYDFKIPSKLDISIDSISISVGSDGVSTTITKSNKSFLPPDQSIILSEGISTNATINSKKMTAGVKNFLKLN